MSKNFSLEFAKMSRGVDVIVMVDHTNIAIGTITYTQYYIVHILFYMKETYWNETDCKPSFYMVQIYGLSMI